MVYNLEVEIHGVTLDGEVSIDCDGAIESLFVFVGSEVCDMSDLLKNGDVYNAIEKDYLSLIANLEV